MARGDPARGRWIRTRDSGGAKAGLRAGLAWLAHGNALVHPNTKRWLSSCEA
jgi:hypothetical protein